MSHEGEFKSFSDLLSSIENNGALHIVWYGREMNDEQFAQLVEAMVKSPTRPKALSVSNNCISSKGCAALVQYMDTEHCSLEEIDLSTNKIGDDGAQRILDCLKRKIPALVTGNLSIKTLNLEQNDEISETVRDSIIAIMALFKLPAHLRERVASVITKADAVEGSHEDGMGNTFDLSGVKLSSIHKTIIPYILSAAPYLRELKVSGCSIGDSGTWDIGMALRHRGAHISSVDLSNNGISTIGCVSFIEASNLASHPGLKSLNFSGNTQLGNDAVSNLMKAVESSSIIDAVDVSKTCVTEKWSKALATACALNRQLPFVKETFLALRDNSEVVKDLDLQWSSTPVEGVMCFIIPAMHGNKVLRSVNLGNCAIGDNGAVLLADAIRQVPALQSVAVPNCKITHTGAVALLQAVGQHPAVEEINLANNDIDSSIIKHAVAMARSNPRLHSVNFDNNSAITPQLRTELDETLLINQCPPVMSTLLPTLRADSPQMSRLDLSGGDHGQYHNDASAKLLSHALLQNTVITHVNLSNNMIGDVGVSYIAQMLMRNKTIRSLSLASNSITNRGAEWLAEALMKNATLKTMNLCDNVISDVGVEPFFAVFDQNDCFSELLVDSNRLRESTSERVQMLCEVNRQPLALKRVLERLRVGDPALTRIDLSGGGHTVQFSNGPDDVRPVALNDNAVELVCAHLHLGSPVRELTLDNNNIGVTACNHLAAFLTTEHGAKIRTLSLCNNPIGDDGAVTLAQALRQNSTLQDLYLAGTKVSSKGVQHIIAALRQNSSVTSVTVPDEVEADTFVALQRELVVNSQPRVLKDLLGRLELNDPSLTELSVHDPEQQLDDVGVRLLCIALARNTQVTKIDLSSNAISSAGAAYLAEALEESSSISVVNLNDNRIGDDGGVRLTKLLEKNGYIQELSVAENQISEAVISEMEYLLLINSGPLRLKQLLFAVASKQELTSEEVDFNGAHGDRILDDESVHLLCTILYQYPSIKTVDLRGNAITDEGAMILSDFLRANSTVEVLRLDDNPIGFEGGEALYQALKRNHTLQTLTFSNTGIADETIEKFAGLLYVNSAPLRGHPPRESVKLEVDKDGVRLQTVKYAEDEQPSIATGATTTTTPAYPALAAAPHPSHTK